MATFKICVFKHQERRDGKYPISIRVTWKRQSAYIKTEYYAVIAQINQRKGIFELKDTYIINKLNARIMEYERRKTELPQPIEYYSAKQLAEELQRSNKVELRQVIEKYRERCKPSRQLFVNTVLTSLDDFTGGFPIMINDLSHSLLESYISFLAIPRKVRSGRNHSRINRGVKFPRKHIGVIQAAFNLYKRDNLNFTMNFPKVAMAKESPAHRVLSIDQLRDLYYTSFENEKLRIAKDIFFLSFFFIGINFIDLFNLGKAKNGKIAYKRSKTKEKRSDEAYIEIEINEAAKFIIDKYSGDSHLLYFCEKHTFKNFQFWLNQKLRKIGEIKGYEKPLTYYYARHTWATLARNECGYAKSDVAEALNHSNSTITDTYIVRDFSRIDEMNKKVSALVTDLS